MVVVVMWDSGTAIVGLIQLGGRPRPLLSIHSQLWFSIAPYRHREQLTRSYNRLYLTGRVLSTPTHHEVPKVSYTQCHRLLACANSGSRFMEEWKVTEWDSQYLDYKVRPMLQS